MPGALPITITVNGERHSLEVEPRLTLLRLLRDRLMLTGTKEGCSTGDCGACSVILDGKLVTSCMVLGVQANGREVTTIEGIGDRENLHPVQHSLVQQDGVQCGYCTPGFVMAAKALLDEIPDPTEAQIRAGLAGNLCRCTGYQKILEAVQEAARLRAAGIEQVKITDRTAAGTG